MTAYTKSTNFTSKDSLASGNPLKIVKGSEIDTEFNNIATAVNTKADLLSPTFTGTPVAPTAAVGTNTTQLATTAFATTVLQKLYPVGSIYISTSAANPTDTFGFGTWVRFGAGKALIGDGLGIFTLGATGGSSDAVVVSHTHTATVTDPGHIHGVVQYQSTGGGASAASSTAVNSVTTNTASSTTGITVANSTTGVSGTNANLPPYIVVAMWNRTA